MTVYFMGLPISSLGLNWQYVQPDSSGDNSIYRLLCFRFSMSGLHLYRWVMQRLYQT